MRGEEEGWVIREAASKTRLCKVSRPICIISVVAASLSLHPSSPSFSSRKLESREREIGIRGFQTTSSRGRKRRQDGFLEIFDNKNFIQDLFSKKVNSYRLNETILFERLMIQEKITSDCYLLQTFHFQVSNCFKFSPERKKGWIFEIENPFLKYKNFIQIIYLDFFSDY